MQPLRKEGAVLPRQKTSLDRCGNWPLSPATRCGQEWSHRPSPFNWVSKVWGFNDFPNLRSPMDVKMTSSFFFYFFFKLKKIQISMIYYEAKTLPQLPLAPGPWSLVWWLVACASRQVLLKSRYGGGMKAEEYRWLLGNNAPSLYELQAPAPWETGVTCCGEGLHSLIGKTHKEKSKRLISH